MNYINILRIYGLKYIELNNEDVSITMNDESIRRVVISKSKYETINNYKYMIISCLLVIWYPIYIIIESILDRTFNPILYNMYPFMILIEYILGLIYYNTDNLLKVLKNNIIDKVYLIPLLLTIIISIICFVYDDINLLIIIFYNIYSNLLLITNGITILLVLNTFRLNVYNFYNILKDKFKLDTIMNIIYIIEDYSRLKNEYDSSIELLNNMFSCIFIFGLGIIYNTFVNNTIYNIINSIIICIILSISLILITQIKSIVSDIRIFINSNLFLTQYFDDYILNNITTEEKDNNPSIVDNIRYLLNSENLAENDEDIIYRVLIKQYEILFTNNWLILNNKLASEWKKFEVWGFELDDITPMKKIIALIIVMYMIVNPVYLL